MTGLRGLNQAMRTWVAVVVIMLGSFSCGPRTRELRPAGSGFRVEVPGEYTCGSWQVDGGTKEIDGRTCEIPVRGSALIRRTPIDMTVSWAHVAPDLELDGLASSLRSIEAGAGGAGERLSERETTMGGIRALEFETVVPFLEYPGRSVTVRTRYMVSQGWLYGLRMSGVLDEAAERTWKRAIESFRLGNQPFAPNAP